jgi:hypothetical protein
MSLGMNQIGYVGQAAEDIVRRKKNYVGKGFPLAVEEAFLLPNGKG